MKSLCNRILTNYTIRSSIAIITGEQLSKNLEVSRCDQAQGADLQRTEDVTCEYSKYL
jgi:hypothetical protein